MELYDAINNRKTTRQFLNKEADFVVIRKILKASYKAPTWNHNRNWHYIILKTEEEKEKILAYAKKEADKFDEKRYLTMPRPYPITLGQKMYGHAMPRQYSMLKDAAYIIIPVVRTKQIGGGSFSQLNPYSTIWCAIENLFLAATAEGLSCSMRIPMDEEHEQAKKILKVPATYQMPAFIGIGYADPDEKQLEQTVPDLEKQLHFGSWK